MQSTAESLASASGGYADIAERYRSSNLTDRQLRYWLEQSLNPAVPVQLILRIVELPPELAPHLEGAWNHFSSAVDATRARLVERDGVPFLEFGSTARPLDRGTLLPADTLGEAVSNWVYPEWTTFRTGDLLFRQALLTTHDGRFVWAFTSSHLVCDGRSNNLIYSTILNTVRLLSRGEALPELSFPSFEANMAIERQRELESRSQIDADPWKRWSADNKVKFSIFGSGDLERVPRRVPVERTLPATSVNQLLARCNTPELFFRSQDVTFANFMTAFVISWVWRHGGQQQQIIGVPFHGRQPGEENLIGFKSEMLPLRIDIDPQSTFVELVQQVHAAAQASLKTRGTSIANPAYAPQYQVSFNNLFQQQAFSRPAESLRNVEVNRQTAAPEAVAVLLHNSTDAPGAMRVTLRLHPAILEFTDTVQLGQGCLETLQSLVENPHQRLQDLSFVDAPSALRFAELSVPRLPALDTSWLPNWIGALEQHGSRTALVHGDDVWTHNDLHDQACRWAGLFVRHGVTPGERILVWAVSSNHLAAAWLGLMSAGAVYVPVHADTPLEKIEDIARTLGARRVLCAAERIGDVGGAGLLPLALDDSALGDVTPEVLRQPEPDAIAHIFHTSGSTGKAKPIAVSHRALATFLHGWITSTGMQPGETIFHFYSITFDPWLSGLLPAIHLGGTCVVSQNGMPPSRSLLLTLLVQHRVTTLCTPTAYFHTLCDIRLPPSVRRWVVGGEALAADKAMRFIERQGNSQPARLINAYGPTETTVWANALPVTPEHANRVPIGPPMPTCGFRVCDEWGNCTPFGVPGELWICGPQVATEYVGQPELTRRQFVDQDGARWYKTGDLVRWRRDGSLDYLGRKDRQVQVRGHRVEPGEIEIALRNLEQISDAVVIPVTVETTTALCAWVIPKDPARPINPVTLRSELMRDLPEYKVPKWFRCIDEFPRNANGKIDTANLPDPDITDNDAVSDDLPTLALWDLRLIFETVLQVPRVGIDDNFFDQGGDSLLLVELIAAIEQRFGLTLEANEVIAHPTIGGLARFVETGTGSPTSLVVTLKKGTAAPLFCIPGAGGVGIEFYPLARLLPDDQPVIALRSSGTDGHKQPPSSARALIDEHVRHILEWRTAQADDRPVHLIGYSLGGVFAWEIAQQLDRLGVPLGQVFVIDAHAATRTGRALLARSKPPLLTRLRRWVRGNPEQRETAILEKQLAACIAEGRVMDPTALGRYNLLVQAALSRQIESRPGPFKLTYFQASKGTRQEQIGIWRSLAPGMEIEIIDGEHNGVASITGHANVAPMAEQVRKRLRDNQ